MAVYGINYYAGSRFGRDPLLVRPDFAVDPFMSLAQDYRTLVLNWKRPLSTDCTQLQLVRNHWNVPQDETDGYLCFPTGWQVTPDTPPPVLPQLGSLTQYDSVSAHTIYHETNANPGFVYYTMFGWDSKNNIWVRCSDLIAVLPVNFGQGDLLYNHLPGMYRERDMVLVDPYDPWRVDPMDPNSSLWLNIQPPLQRYLSLIGFQLDFIRTEMEGLLEINDAQKIPGQLLPLLSYQFGMITEPEIGMQQERQLTENAIHLYKLKGSGRGITEFAAMLTSYPCMLVHKGYNLLLCLEDSTAPTPFPPAPATQRPGTWQAWPTTLSPFSTDSVEPLVADNAGLTFVQSPNLYNVPNMTTSPLNPFPQNPPGSTLFPADKLNPPYGGADGNEPTGFGVYVTTAGSTIDITTGGIPTLDFQSSFDPAEAGDMTWEVEVWSPVQRTMELSVWGSDGGPNPIQVIPPSTFATVLHDWTRVHVYGSTVYSLTSSYSGTGGPNQSYGPLNTSTGPFNGSGEIVQVNGVTWKRVTTLTGQSPTAQVYTLSGGTVTFGNGDPVALTGNGAMPPVPTPVLGVTQPNIVITFGHYDHLYPRIRILSPGANETHYFTLLAMWATHPSNIGTYVPYYDYPRDLKVTLEPQSMNLLANPLTTFPHGTDGWGCTSNEPRNIENVINAQQWAFGAGTTAGYTAGLNTTLSSTTVWADQGPNSLAMTANAAGDISASTAFGQQGYRIWWDMTGNLTGSTDAAGIQYSVRATFHANTTGRACSLRFNWYTATGNYISTSTVGPVTDIATGGTDVTGQITAPAGAVYLGYITPYVAACAAGETHEVDDIWVQGLPYWGLLGQNQNASVPFGNAGLQVQVIQAPSTVWGGTVNTFNPAPTPSYGWFVDPKGNWYPGNTFGTTKTEYWFEDPITDNPLWFALSGNYFGVPNIWSGGHWFPHPTATPTANLVGFETPPLAWYNFSIFAAMVSGDLARGRMDIGFRWYFPDDTWHHDPNSPTDEYPNEDYWTVQLTNTMQRYPPPSTPTQTNASQCPIQDLTGASASMFFVFVRFPNALPGDLFLLNGAMLTPGKSQPPFDDASMHPGSPDYIIDAQGSSSYYRRLAPRTARLRAEMYRWIPMGATYTLGFGSSLTEPAFDQTTWPP